MVPAYEKSLGRYTNLGDRYQLRDGDRPRSYSDRINISLQRQLPQGIVLDVTYYLNFTNQLIGRVQRQPDRPARGV